ncbi:hypothetical protein GL50803_008942 [Giardia duodenalis]|uniref:Cilia- and flagella-associated protein 300 n=1 Tax=Giardia intestinalis (strain ATCC 50803 / WB clone C6) TaxID=184922 RepID=A8BB56_GIAIC|nr:hypothetical protein GL50803_008942 [Giardia intestinalis]KAE8302079.1 hypothetical protein GL50803_008942 [Giardia intestinalis]|eukprot:XP_001708213.1 Hypothetical protein GL50803_8942 [Giardia lamblia ATCC 50803]
MSFSFSHLSSFRGIDGLDRDAHDLLQQWGLDHSFKSAQFAFSKQYHPSNADTFLSDFFADASVREAFLLPDISGMQTLPLPSPESDRLRYEVMHVTKVDTSALLPAISHRFVSGSSFKGRTPHKLQRLDMDVSYEIDEALFDVDSELYQLFTPEWRSELLCALFSILRAGGALNQQSVDVMNYIKLSTDLYRLHVHPLRVCEEDSLTLSHIHAYRIIEVGSADLFPRQRDFDLHPSNRCFVIIDSHRRMVTIIYNSVYL